MHGDAARLLFVHAHPDDETINNGATMALYAARGAQVTLVTCTRGEQGEVIPAELAHLDPTGEEGRGGDALGRHRERELAAAMAALGVGDHRFLGAPPLVYRDSGMAYADDGRVVPARHSPPGAFATADVDEAAAHLAGVVRQVRPHAVVTYDPGGGYGHPDHVQAHRVAMRAVDVSARAADGVPGWEVPKVYWTVLPQSAARLELAEWAMRGAAMPSMVVPDDLVTTRVDASEFRAAKVAAMRAHATQLAVDHEGASFALSNGVRRPISGFEFYHLVRGEPSGERDAAGRETDLLAGV